MYLICNNCFKNFGLRYEATKIGVRLDKNCDNCNTRNGVFLNLENCLHLMQIFFVYGSYQKCDFGGSHSIQFNEYHKNQNEVEFDASLQEDASLIQKITKTGIFHYGPPLWMLGEISPLQKLRNKYKRPTAANHIVDIFPSYILTSKIDLFRIRINIPKNEIIQDSSFDSPPDIFSKIGRLNFKGFPSLYASENLEICIHECRSTVIDDIKVANISPKFDLKLLDLTATIQEDGTPYDSYNIGINHLFSAENHSYTYCHAIALAARNKGYHGIKYPSYFSFLRNETIPNISIFGRPIQEGVLKVKSINTIKINSSNYKFSFGPATIR